MTNRVSLIAAILLLTLPALYFASYSALVVPHGNWVQISGLQHTWIRKGDYRLGGEGICPLVFWPLEKIDRKLRPVAWAGLPDFADDRSPHLPLREWQAARTGGGGWSSAGS